MIVDVQWMEPAWNHGDDSLDAGNLGNEGMSS
jgi:hypothetical protein